MVRTTDATGTEVELHLGEGSVRLASGLDVRVPLFRAPSFPYFEETVRALGGDIHGLLGLSALGARRIVFDAEASVVRLQP